MTDPLVPAPAPSPFYCRGNRWLFVALYRSPCFLFQLGVLRVLFSIGWCRNLNDIKRAQTRPVEDTKPE